MFHSKKFENPVRCAEIDAWLNSFKNPYVVGYEKICTLEIIITIKERPEPYDTSKFAPVQTRTTIDDIPEEPSVQV